MLVLSRSFTAVPDNQKAAVQRFEMERRSYRENVKKLRKQYATETKDLEEQYDIIRK